MTPCKGYIDSVYSGSAVDGSGLRCVVFLSGCNLRCGFCHNPETLFKKGNEVTPAELLERILRYKAYIKKGGVTLSGGEPFLQKEFVISICELLHREGIDVCIETNGHITDSEIIAAADSFIVDVKNQESFDFCVHTEVYEKFISAAVGQNKPIKLTNVLVPGVNDNKESICAIKEISKNIPVHLFKGIKFLPFRKLCVGKYEKLGLEFPYASYRECEKDDIALAMEIYKNI